MMRVLCLLLGYLLGNFSTGILIAQHRGTDIRHEGSGNPGTTNVIRVIGTKAGVFTFVGDFGKAVLAVLLGRWIGGEDALLCSMCSSLGVIVGHNWPVLYGFKGGKGVACSTAILLMMYPVNGLVSVAVCLLAIFLTRYVSLGSLMMVFTFMLLTFMNTGFLPAMLWAAVICVMCFFRHARNIRRLMNGTENRLHFSKKEKS